MCVSVCLQEYLQNHVRYLLNLWCMLPMAVAQSSSGVVVIQYVLPVLWMTSCFNGPYSGMNFAMKYRFHLNLLIYRKDRQNSISYY